MGQDVTEAPPNFVFYELSNLRIERDILGEVIAFDYRRTREGMGLTVSLKARSESGPVTIAGYSEITDRSGTIRLEERDPLFRSLYSRLRSDKQGIEFYFIAAASPIAQLNNDKFLVSNIIKHGEVAKPLQVAALTPEQKNMFEQIRKRSLPPETVPSGYVLCSRDVYLKPGAPVLVAMSGEWKPGKVVSVNDVFVKVLPDESRKVRQVPIEGKWLAVSIEVIGQLRTNPSQFSMKLPMLPDGNLLFEEGMEAVSDPKVLCPGTPILVEDGNQWVERYIVSIDNVSARILDPTKDITSAEYVPLKSLAIRTQTLQDLKKPTAKEDFSKNIKNIKAMALDYSGDTPMNTAPFPKSSVNATPVENGLAPSSIGIPAGGPSMRTWQDRTGKFKVEAELVDKSDTAVTLKKKDGSTIQVPIDKLSEADQAYLRDSMPGARSSGSTSVDFRTPMQVVRQFVKLQSRAVSLAISPDDRMLLIGLSTYGALLVDIETGQVLIKSGRMEHMQDITVAAFSPNGQYMIIGGSTGVIEIYQRSLQGKSKQGWALSRQFFGHVDDVKCLAFSSDSRFAISGGDDKKALYWSLETGETIASLGEFEESVKAVCIRAEDNLLLATDAEKLSVYNAATGTEVESIGLLEYSFSSTGAAFSPNGKLLTIADTSDIRLWNLDSYSEMPRIKSPDRQEAIRFAPDSRHFFSASSGAINVWDAKTQSRLFVQQVPGRSVGGVVVNYNGTMVACSNDYDAATVFRLGTSQ